MKKSKKELKEAKDEFKKLSIFVVTVEYIDVIYKIPDEKIYDFHEYIIDYNEQEK